MNNLATKAVLEEVFLERCRQDARWGEQNHPNFIVDFLPTEIPPQHIPRFNCMVHRLPSQAMAKEICENAFAKGEGTFGHILIEEVAEAFEEVNDIQALRAELVQVAAVTVAWIEAIDRRLNVNGD